MVSTDHFRHELRAQLARATTVGRIDLLVNSGELCRSIANGSSTAASCFEAMEAEFMPGDTLLLDRTNGAGMTVRIFCREPAAFKSVFHSNQTR